MKKFKALSALLALLLCVSVLLASCTEAESEEVSTYKLSGIMNGDWKADKDAVIATFKDASYIGNYDASASKYGFIVTATVPESANSESASTVSTLVTRVYNTAIDQAVATLNNTSTKEIVIADGAEKTQITTKINYVNIISAEYFAVLTTTYVGSSISAYNTSAYFGCPLSDFYEYSLTVYDALGAIKTTYHNEEILALCNNNIFNFDNIYGGKDSSAITYKYRAVSEIFNDLRSDFDLYAIGSKVYRFDSKLKSTLVKDFGVASMPSLDNMKKVGTNYLEAVDGVYSVYDNNLIKLFDYTIPGYADGNAFLLANGNLLAQYSVQLDQNEKNYDIRQGADEKYDLVTVLVTSEKATELEKVNYVIGDVMPSVADSDGKKIYAANVENLAFIYEIGENKMVDNSYANKKLVVLGSDGIIKGNVNIDGNIASFPIHYTDGKYAAMLSDGNCAIYNNNGDKIDVLSGEIMKLSRIAGEYVLLGDAIYDTDGDKVYDIAENHAIVEKCGNTVIVKKYSTTSIEIGVFVDGVVKNIGIIAKEEMNSTIGGFGFSEAGYYYTFDKQTNKYSYYNAKGDLIVSFDRALEQIIATDEYLIMRDTANNVFYKFSFSK